MAATATKPGAKEPLAGMTGYDPLKADSDLVQNTEQERQVTPVAPRQKRVVSQKAVDTAKKASGEDLVAYLVSSGTNPEKLGGVKVWLIDNSDATAEQLFRYLESAEENGDPPTAQGTLRKAGKWLWGDQWDLETSSHTHPSEENEKLRKQVASLQAQQAQLNSELASVRQQTAFLQEQLKDKSSENALLKKGRDPTEFGPGKNVLEMSGAPV